MDLVESIIHRYRGEARLQRLLWVARHSSESSSPNTSTNNSNNSSSSSSSSSFQTAAYQAAARQMKEAGNVHRYKEVFGSTTGTNISGRSSGVSTGSTGTSTGNNLAHRHHILYDAAWVHDAEHTNRRSRDVLTSRLQAAQAHLNKEAIRAAYLALAEHDGATGDLTEAFHAVLRAKDYCTSRQQTGQVSLAILELSLQLKHFAQVKEYVTRLEHTMGNHFESAAVAAATATATATAANNSSGGGAAASASASSIQNKVLTASALERLAAGDFAKASEKFALVAKNGQVEWDSVLAPEEVSLYAAFLSLAVESRDQMVALAEHPEALELVPAARECLTQFGRRAAYQTCWKMLDEEHVFDALKMDIYMAPHLATLQQMIREKCVLQYWQAYQRVELSVMADDLQGLVESETSLLDLLVRLIRQGTIGSDTRIDMRSRTVVRDDVTADDVERRCLEATKHRLRNVTRRVLDDTYSSIIRLACVEYDLSVTDPGQQATSKRRGLRGNATETEGVYDLSNEYGGGAGGGVEQMGSYDDDDDDDDEMADVDAAMNPEDMY
jgi:COP9 signalosome complex subunit 1